MCVGEPTGEAKQQRVSLLQHDLTGTLLDAFSLPGNGNQDHIILLFKVSVLHLLAHQRTGETDVRHLQAPVAVDFIQSKHVVGGIDQVMGLPQFQNPLDITGEHQTVTTEDELVLTHRGDDFMVKTDNLNDVSAGDLVKPGFLDSLSHMRTFRRYQQLDRVVRDILQRILLRFPYRQQPAQCQCGENTDHQAEHTHDRRCEQSHRLPVSSA